MLPPRVRIALCAIAVASSAPLTSSAQDPGTRARELFVEGRNDLSRGDVDAACRKFLESHELAPDAAGPLLNVADCDERAGRVASAWRRFKKVVSLPPAANDRRQYAAERATALEPRVPRVVLELPSDAPKDTRVTQDGVALAPEVLKAPLPLDPGRYRFVVSAPGRRERAYDVDMQERMTHRISLRLGDPVAPPAKPAPRPEAPAQGGLSTQALAGWITGGVGGAALVVGIVTGALVALHAGTYEDHCDDGVCDDEGMRAASSGKPLAIVSPIFFGVGIAAIAVAIPLLVTSPEMSAMRASLRVARDGTFTFAVGGAF